MAFTKTPEVSTHKTQQLLFDGKDTFRSGDLSVARDLQIVNMYYDIVGGLEREKEVWIKKRPGLSASSYAMGKAANTDPIRGHYYSSDDNALFWVANSTVWRLKPDVSSTPINILTLTTTGGLVGFCEYLKSDNTRYIVITDGLKMYLHNLSGVSSAEIVSADLPSPHIPSPVYLNGYIFIAKLNTGDIYNSNVDDPVSWTAGDFMTVEMKADYLKKLVRTKNYIVALGTSSIEYFYDKGIATGSPIQRNDSPFRTIGYVTGLCEIGDTVFFVGQEGGQNMRIYALNGFQIKEISTEVVDRSLQVTSSTPNTKGSVYLNRNGMAVSVDGHTFYVLTTTQTTWAYDLTNNIWYEWKNSADAALGIEASWSMYNGGCYLAITDQTAVSVFSPKTYQDFGVNFNAVYVTEKIDFGTWNRKNMSKLLVYTDRHNNVGTSNMTVQWSDNDYTTFTTARNINVFSRRPCIWQLGMFSNRAFKFTYADNYPIRWKGIEFEINVGRS